MGRDLLPVGTMAAFLAFPLLTALASSLRGRLRFSITLALCSVVSFCLLAGTLAAVIWAYAPGRIWLDDRTLQEYRIDSLSGFFLSPASGSAVAGVALGIAVAAVFAAADIRGGAVKNETAV